MFTDQYLHLTFCFWRLYAYLNSCYYDFMHIVVTFTRKGVLYETHVLYYTTCNRLGIIRLYLSDSNVYVRYKHRTTKDTTNLTRTVIILLLYILPALETKSYTPMGYTRHVTNRSVYTCQYKRMHYAYNTLTAVNYIYCYRFQNLCCLC